MTALLIVLLYLKSVVNVGLLIAKEYFYAGFSTFTDQQSKTRRFLHLFKNKKRKRRRKAADPHIGDAEVRVCLQVFALKIIIWQQSIGLQINVSDVTVSR